MRALGFEPKKEEIRKMIADIDKDGSGIYMLTMGVSLINALLLLCFGVSRYNRFQ